MNQVVIGIGSNIEPRINIQKAREILLTEFEVIKESSFMETKPIGNLNQANFTNGAILIQTDLSANEFKTQLRKIEERLGRNRTSIKNSPRKIDLDIIVWNGDIVDPDIYERDFLKQTTLEVWPLLSMDQQRRKKEK